MTKIIFPGNYASYTKLRELDINLQHYGRLEYGILFPRALAMERELVIRE